MMDEFETIALLALVTAIIACAAVVFIRSRPSEEAQSNLEVNFNSPPHTSSSDRREPRIPGAVSRPPDWMLNESDQSFDLKAFYSPIPDEQNAAPLYLDALAEFHSAMAICFPEKKADSIKECCYLRGKKFLWKWGYESGRLVYQTTPAEADKLLATYETGFKKISAAQKRPRCDFHTALTLFANWPHLVAARYFTSIASLRVTRCLERGEFHRALQTLVVICRLGRDLRARSPLIGQLAAVAIDGIAGWTTLDILSAHGMTLEWIDQLIAILAEQDYFAQPNPLAEGWKVEYVLFRNYLHDLELRTGIFSPEGFAYLSKTLSKKITTPGEYIIESNTFAEKTFNTKPTRSMSAREIDEIINRFRTTEWKKEIRATSIYFKELIDTAALPYLQQREARDRLAPRLEDSLVLSIGCRSTHLIPIALIRAEAIRRGILCLATVNRWELLHGSPPPDLDTACKEAGLDSIPIDPFSGGPMRLTKIKGKSVVYSVGPDGKDDGGLVEWSGEDTPGDIVFRMPQRS